MWEFPSLAVLLYSLSVLGDEVYVSGNLRDPWLSGITTRLSGEELLPPTVAVQNPWGAGRPPGGA